MLKVLLEARRRHYLNFIRYHFDRTTILILLAIGAWMIFQLWRSPADIGYSLRALSRSGSGGDWVMKLAAGLPLLFLLLYVMARSSVRRTPDLDLVRSLPVTGGTLRQWLFVRHLVRTGPILLLLALPALGDPTIGLPQVSRALGVLLGGLVLDYFALRLAARSRRRRSASPGREAAALAHPVPEARLRLRVPIRGGTVSALLLRDASYLLRRNLATVMLVAAAFVAEVWIAAAGSDPGEALLAAAVIHVLHAAIQLSSLEVLFERDIRHAALLRMLPVGGGRLWRARALLAAAVLALPGLTPGLIAVARGAPAAAWAAFVAGAILVLPIIGGLLYADVHVALFPRTRVAAFLLVSFLVAIVLFWFFVPLATPLLILGLLIPWSSRAARAFDRLETE